MGLINGFAKDWIMTAVSMAYIGLGIASLVLTSPTWSRNSAVNCGFGGSPPLRTWIFGTGIAYILVGAIYVVVWLAIWKTANKKVFAPIAYVVTAFVLAWTIVGAVSLWRDGGDCLNQSYSLWAMGMSDVIVSIVFVSASILYLPNFRSDGDALRV